MEGQKDLHQLKSVELQNTGGEDGIKKILVTRRDPVARVISYVAAGVAIIGFTGNLLYTVHARSQSPINDTEFAAYQQGLNRQKDEMEKLKLQLDEEVVKTKMAGFLVLRQVTGGKMTYKEYADQIDTLYKDSKDLSSVFKK